MGLFSKRGYSRLSKSNGNSPRRNNVQNSKSNGNSPRRNNVQNSKANIGSNMRNSLKRYLRNHANITYNANTPLFDYIHPTWRILLIEMGAKKKDLYRPANRQLLIQSILDVMTNEELAIMPQFWMGPGANRLAGATPM